VSNFVFELLLCVVCILYLKVDVGLIEWVYVTVECVHEG